MAMRGRRCVFLFLSCCLLMVLLLTSHWLPQGGDCDRSWHPCLSFHRQASLPPDQPVSLAVREEGEVSVAVQAPPLQVCPGQQFQVWRLLAYLGSALGPNNDVLLDPYLDSWDELLRFMNSLGPLVSFFSQKVEEKTSLIRQLALEDREHAGKRGPSELQVPGAYSSVSSMVETELRRGVVSFERRSRSGSRTLLRLHRSLLWLQLLLEGLREGPDAGGQYRSPGDLCREAYLQALAPHHPWLLRRAAELLFLALPERQVFLELVCVRSQDEAGPVLHTLTHALRLVHTRTQLLLETHNMLELP
ncbi:ceramide-1-phosphate transfer protein [Osmerus mordax]|uniref:ceramide-1-phosphate transfer protein n=1 Tax=Osmerus mordax TaxID=8014 RepID=UPI0035105577